MISYQAMTAEPTPPDLPSFPPQPESSVEHAEAYLSTGLLVEAAELFEALVETPEAFRAHLGLARCAYRSGRLHEALGYLQAAAQIDPDRAELYNDMGVVLFSLGLPDQAREQFERAAAQQPAEVQPVRNLLDVAVATNDVAACEEYARRILAVDPGDADARAILDQMEDRGEPEVIQTEYSHKLIDAAREQETRDEIAPGAIEGVTVRNLTSGVDDRGYCVQFLEAAEAMLAQSASVCLVGEHRAGTVRGFHKSRARWNWFFVGHGSAKFVMVDDRMGSPTRGQQMIAVVGERNPSLIVVPPGVYFGWMALTDDAQMVCTASPISGHQDADDITVAEDSFGDVWNVNRR